MKVKCSLSAGQEGASIIPLGLSRPVYLKDAVITISDIAQEVTFSFSVLNESGDEIFSEASLGPKSTTLVKPDLVLHPGYQLSVTPSAGLEGDVTVNITLSLNEQGWF